MQILRPMNRDLILATKQCGRRRKLSRKRGRGKPSLPTPANNAIAHAKSAPQPTARSPQPAALEVNSIGMLSVASEQGQFGATTAED